MDSETNELYEVYMYIINLRYELLNCLSCDIWLFR